MAMAVQSRPHQQQNFLHQQQPPLQLMGAGSPEDGMELRLLDSAGLPAGSLVSIRVGQTRRQAVLGSQRPYRFSDCKGKQQMKVDVYAPIAHARLLIDPVEARVNLELDPPPQTAGEAPMGNMAYAGFYGQQNMAIEFEVGGITKDADGGSEAEVGFIGGKDNASFNEHKSPPTRPSTANTDKLSAFGPNSASRRAHVAKEAQPYFEQHSLIEVMQTLLQAVIKEKPADPYGYMIRVLQNSSKAAQGKRSQRPHSAAARTTPMKDGAEKDQRHVRVRPQSAHPRSQTRFAGSRQPAPGVGGALLEGLPGGPDGEIMLDDCDMGNQAGMMGVPVGSARNVIRAQGAQGNQAMYNGQMNFQGQMPMGQMPPHMHMRNNMGPPGHDQYQQQQQGFFSGGAQFDYMRHGTGPMPPPMSPNGLMPPTMPCGPPAPMPAAGLTPQQPVMPPSKPPPGSVRPGGPRAVQEVDPYSRAAAEAVSPHQVEHCRRSIRDELVVKAQRGELSSLLESCLEDDNYSPCGHAKDYSMNQSMNQSYNQFDQGMMQQTPMGVGFGMDGACGTDLERLRIRLRDGLHQAADAGTLPRLLDEAATLAHQNAPPATISQGRGGVAPCGTRPGPSPPRPPSSWMNQDSTMSVQLSAKGPMPPPFPPPQQFSSPGQVPQPPPGCPPDYMSMSPGNWNQSGNISNEVQNLRGEMTSFMHRTSQLEDMVQRLINENSTLRDAVKTQQPMNMSMANTIR
eukprot:TRINITY_DN20271_c0_g1_i1.p1 TRINITY_DN20271_c0_g1~~TRINITY_DN20271_c0_g1_i1.p1  ORF type:complete len:736 (+),score=192.28 TRINITY_DN20271_c0_g1_i1:195-2402(+)